MEKVIIKKDNGKNIEEKVVYYENILNNPIQYGHIYRCFLGDKMIAYIYLLRS